MMKKIFAVLILFGLFTVPAYSQNEITFIYLNGSNTNTEKSKEDFIKGVDKLHSKIVLNFNKNDFIKKHVLKNGEYAINPEAKIFYWGDFSKNEIEFIEEDFDFMKAISPKPASYVRKFIALCLHDAIWVSKTENMYPIVNKLHESIKEEIKKGNKIVLVGYSAGTFITHEYMLIKAPIINLFEILSKRADTQKFANYISENNIKNTCSDAVFKTGLVQYNIENKFTFENNFDSFVKKAKLLNGYTEEYCASEGAIAGGINYASPYALFYSELFDKSYQMTEAMALSYKYMVENDMFWLTVNYSDDPLGFPFSRNVTIDKVKEATNLDIEPNGGFIYDKSDTPSRRTFILAHLSYFSTAKRYSKILSKALDDGYKYFYMTKED